MTTPWRSLRPLLPSRRSLLRGSLRGLAVALALPPLECFFNGSGTAYACGGAIPRRFGLFFWGNGNLPDYWTPAETGAEWTLSEELAPLAALQSQITLITGMAVKFPNVYPHGSGLSGLLTGIDMVEVGSDTTVGGPSIDQLIAEQIGGETIYASLQTAATGASGQSYNGPSSRNPAETDPYLFFERIFGPTFRAPGEEGIVDPSLGLRRSVLDAVMGDISALQSRVGAADKVRLEQHFDGVRELEQRLARLEEDPPDLESCARPADPTADFSDIDGRPQISLRNRAMVDMLAMALACDQTRVFGHYLTDPVSDALFPGASAGHHSLTHNELGDQPEVNAITVAIMEEFAYLVQAFAAIPEADGSLLDNCAVLATSEVSHGQTHAIDEIPLIIAGGACGSLRMGYHHRSYAQDNASKVMLTLIRAMDISADSFGEAEGYADEGISEIEL
jgi:Protein of unknown function (DUF1552)